jgi:hypothetical protein
MLNGLQKESVDGTVELHPRLDACSCDKSCSTRKQSTLVQLQRLIKQE